MRYAQIALLNESTALSDDQLVVITEALRIHVHRDLAPVWNGDADLILFRKVGLQALAAKNQKVSDLYPNAWQLHIMDRSTELGALGFHETTEAGQPSLYAFVADDIKYGLQPSCTIAHEIDESLIDPYIVWTVFVQATNSSGRLYSGEICDAIESDEDGYEIEVPPTSVTTSPTKVLMSDFVFPAWFEPELARGIKLDFTGKLTIPLTLSNGGYISIFDIPNTGGWSQLNADKVPDYKLVAPKGSRRWRRANKEAK